MTSEVTAHSPETAGTVAAPVATAVFVGDDPAVVQTMRDAAQRRSGVWDVHFANSSEAAAAIVGELSSVDVLVANARVAGAPVADVLSMVRERSPHTARIILSAQSDRDAVLHLIGAAHQYLSVPVDVELLDEVIEHIRCAVGNELRDPVKTLIGQVDQLPSPPALFQRLSAMLASDNWSLVDVAGEIAQDVALTGEILKLANSSFFGTAERVTSIERAIAMVGMDLIRFAVLGSKLFQPNESLELWLDVDRLDQRSKAIAHATRALALRERLPADETAVAYLTGMVSEIGLLVMARIPDISPSIAQPVNVGTYPGAERAIFGGDRFEVGAHLLRLWGFHDTVIDAVGHLSDNSAPCNTLQWHLLAARRLVLDRGFDPHDLASPIGSRPDVDEALDHLHEQIESRNLEQA